MNHTTGATSGTGISPLRSGTQRLARSFSAARFLLRKQLWVWPILAAALLAAIGYWLRTSVERQLHREMAADLQTILDTDVAALRLWLKAQEHTAEALAADPGVLATVAILAEMAARPEISSRELLQAAELAALRRELAPHLERRGHDDFVVVTPTGRVCAAGRDELVGQAYEDPVLRAGLERILAGKSLVTPPWKSRIALPDDNGEFRAGLPTMFALAPLLDGDGRPFAVLGIRIAPEREFTRLLQIAWTGECGETYAFDREGRLVSQSRFDEQLRTIGLLTEDADSILNLTLRDPGVDLTRGGRPRLLRSQQPLTRMAAEATAGRSGVDVSGYRDYRGVPSIGAWTWLDDYGLGVATERERADAYQVLSTVRLAVWGLLALLIAAAAAIFVYSVLLARASQTARRAVLESKRLGQYALDEKIGEGGMGVVYRARHALLHRPTAIKFLQAEKTTEQSIARFEREVQLTSRLNHPNTITVYDYGRTPEGVFYYAMEYLDGINLEELVRRFGAQPEGRVVYLLRQVCGSLAEAHDLGLIHRDIKPSNIIVSRRGGLPDVVKVLDFGLVKAVDEREQGPLTEAGAVTGTPLYLAPEALRNPDAVDARSDLYALGAVGYFLLTGQPLFQTQSLAEVLTHQLQTPPAPPSQRLGRPVDPALEAVLLQCLAKRPEQRPGSAAELSRLLAHSDAAGRWSEEDARRWWQQYFPTQPRTDHKSPDTTGIAATAALTAEGL